MSAHPPPQSYDHLERLKGIVGVLQMDLTAMCLTHTTNHSEVIARIVEYHIEMMERLTMYQ